MSAGEKVAEQALEVADFAPIISVADAAALRASFMDARGQAIYAQGVAVQSRVELVDFICSLKTESNWDAAFDLLECLREDVERFEIIAGVCRTAELRALLAVHSAIGATWAETKANPSPWEVALDAYEAEVHHESAGFDDGIVPAINRLMETEAPSFDALALKLKIALAVDHDPAPEHRLAILADIDRLITKQTADRYVTAAQFIDEGAAR